MSEMNKKIENPFQDKKVAAAYDSFYDTDLGEIYDRLEKDAILSLVDKKGGDLLEFGSGTGHWSDFFAKIGFNVIGVEISDAMLEVARVKKFDNVQFIKGDVEKIDLGQKFDVVAILTALEFLNNPKIAVENAIKHLKPGGIIIIGVLNQDSELGRSRKQSEAITPYSFAKFYTKDELQLLFEKYGEVELKYCTLNGDNFFIAGRIDVGL